MSVKKGTELKLSLILETENGNRIGGAVYTFTISYMKNYHSFNAHTWSDYLERIFEGRRDKLYAPEGTNWETTFYLKQPDFE